MISWLLLLLILINGRTILLLLLLRLRLTDAGVEAQCTAAVGDEAEGETGDHHQQQLEQILKEACHQVFRCAAAGGEEVGDIHEKGGFMRKVGVCVFA